MKESLLDLNSMLFQQLERLGNEDLEGDRLQEEITRAKAITDVSTTVIQNAHLVLQAARFKHDDRMSSNRSLPRMLGGSDEQ